MSSMELIIKVLCIKRRELAFLLMNTMVLVLFYYLLFENSELIYPLMMSGFMIGIYFILEVVRYRQFSKKLENSKRTLDDNISNVTYGETEILEVLNEVHQQYLNQIHTLHMEITERDTLFSHWIHNMKTSITVIDLACEKSIEIHGGQGCIDDIKEENSSLKKNLEECLNVLRLDDFSRDYITDPCNLRALVNQVVNVKKRDFIYKGVFPGVVIDESLEVYTDQKWCGYMLEQIISNAIKYSKIKSENSVEIIATTTDEGIELVISDQGIGISAADLPRVFDSFYTGSNGRNDRNATGIGLYMVKIISKKLGHEIEIESELEVGTRVKIIFKCDDRVSI
ncbi:MAG: sensor histidine kinase [Turicibacter sp.]